MTQQQVMRRAQTTDRPVRGVGVSMQVWSNPQAVKEYQGAQRIKVLTSCHHLSCLPAVDFSPMLKRVGDPRSDAIILYVPYIFIIRVSYVYVIVLPCVDLRFTTQHRRQATKATINIILYDDDKYIDFPHNAPAGPVCDRNILGSFSTLHNNNKNVSQNYWTATRRTRRSMVLR